MWKRLSPALLGLMVLLIPIGVSAHEVYVLSHDEIARGLAMPSFSEISVILANVDQFALWAFITALVIFIAFFTSISRSLEKRFDPFFARTKKYAPAVARVTVGVAFLAGAYYQASYGPELPFSTGFGAYAPFATVALVVMGILLIVNKFVRPAAFVALGFFTVSVVEHGWYMLTYTNYLGEILALALVAEPGQAWKGFFGHISRSLAPYKFLIVRICFGISLLYASMYAKIIHNDLALQVATLPLAGHVHSLAMNLGFEPHFLVVGAAIIEIVIALFFMLGIEIRFTSLFLEFWLTLSLLYFGEVVWPHLILIGIPISFILYGYDQYSLEGRFFKKGSREPVL